MTWLTDCQLPDERFELHPHVLLANRPISKPHALGRVRFHGTGAKGKPLRGRPPGLPGG